MIARRAVLAIPRIVRRCSASSAPKISQTETFGIGGLMGCFGGLVGLGGGLVGVPLLSMRITPHQAIGTSLAAVLASSSFAAASFYVSGDPESTVHPGAAMLLAGPAMLTASVGAKLGARMTAKQLKLGITLFIASTIPAVVLKPYYMPKKADGAPDNHIDLTNPVTAVDLAALGAFTGVASGMFGVGGGLVMVPFLSILSNHQQAIATSLLAILPIAASGVASHMKLGSVVVRIVPALCAGSAVGGVVGSQLAMQLTEEQQRAVFAAIMLAVLARYVIKK